MSDPMTCPIPAPEAEADLKRLCEFNKKMMQKYSDEERLNILDGMLDGFAKLHGFETGDKSNA